MTKKLIKSKKFVNGSTGKKKSPRTRPTGYDIRIDHKHTYIRKSDKRQVYYDQDSGRYYTQEPFEDRYTLVPKKAEGVINRYERPETWTHWKRGKKWLEGGRLVFVKNGEPILMVNEQTAVIYDKRTRGYIDVPLSELKGVKREEKWPKDCIWGSPKGRVLVKSALSYGGEGSTSDAIDIYLNGVKIKNISYGYTRGAVYTGRNFNDAMQIAYDLAKEVGDIDE